MRPQIIARQLQLEPGTQDYVQHRLALALDRTLNQIGAITVRLHDVNGPRGGVDKVCQILLVIPGRTRIVITERALELRAAIDRAAHRAARAVSRVLGRSKSHKQKSAGVMSDLEQWQGSEQGREGQ